MTSPGLEGVRVGVRRSRTPLMQASAFVVVLSPNSIDSEWVEKEFMYANSLKKKIIPLLYQPCKTPIVVHQLAFH